MIGADGGGATDPVGGIVSGAINVITGGAGNVAGAVVGSVIDGFVRSMAQAAVNLLSMLSTFWLNVPSPPIVATGTTHPTALIQQISGDLSWYTVVFAMLGVFLAAGKMAISHRGSDVKPVLYMLGALTVVTGAGAAVVALCINAGDQFAPWIIARATGGGSFSASAANLLSVNALMGQGAGMGLLVALAALLGALAQFCFMIFRSAMITLMMCVLPTIAATSATEGGSAALRKAFGWLTAFVLYKPVAAIIYAVGFMMIKANEAPAVGETTDQASLMQMLTGLMIIVLAALTLPALIKFLVPMASAGVSSMFSGAALGAATVAVGAAVVTMGAGAGAGAGSGGGAVKSAASAAPTGSNPAASPPMTSTPDPTGGGGAGNPGSSPSTKSPSNAQGAKPSDGDGHSGGGGAHHWKDAAQTARGASDGVRSASDGVDEGGAGPAGAPVSR